MSELNSSIILRTGEYRPCVVNGQKALFHRWEDKAEIVAPSVMVGGHNGGTIKGTLGIIEREDGSIHECYPHEIVFCDRLMSEYVFPECCETRDKCKFVKPMGCKNAERK